MNLEEAKTVAAKLVQTISPLCKKVEVAGSIRRKRPEVNDIDLVLIPEEWKWNSIANQIRRHFTARIVAAGPELIRLTIPAIHGLSEKSEPIQVDLYRARPETWGTLLLIRTGSVDHNIMMCSRAQRMGLMLSAKQGVIQHGKVIAGATEESIFAALKMPFVEPEDREI